MWQMENIKHVDLWQPYIATRFHINNPGDEKEKFRIK